MLGLSASSSCNMTWHGVIGICFLSDIDGGCGVVVVVVGVMVVVAAASPSCCVYCGGDGS